MYIFVLYIDYMYSYSYSLNLLHANELFMHMRILLNTASKKIRKVNFLIGLYFGTNRIEKNPAA